MPTKDHTVLAGVNVSVATWCDGRFSGVHQWPVLGVHRGTSVVAGLLPKDRGMPVAPASVLTAPTPDVRVRVNTSLVMPRDKLIPMLQVEVQNHSPVVVYLKNLCLVMQDGHQIFAPRDAVTGSRFLGSEIQPSRSYGFFYSPEDLREALENSPIICAAAKDEIGREYRSDEEEMRKVLLQLFPPSKTL